jgi:lipopolysaccharide/colanic/teichoic acid biosynthesis glycosyltransferase
MVKRFVDVVLSAVGLLLLSPFFLLLAPVIKLDSHGPVFYRGVRVGRHGRPFKIYKFRSMVYNAERKGAASTSTTDLRVTRSGNFIRKFKFDEFSQLINVFLGDMSLVGPRPEVQKFVDRYTPEEKVILTVRPGITDWSSIKFHNEGEIIEASGIPDADEAYEKLIRPEKLRLQLKYVKERNLWVDVKIVVSTVLTLFSTRLGGRPIGVPEEEI